MQELQRRRKSRQLKGHNCEVALHQPLWVIKELVNPTLIACLKIEQFSRWTDKQDLDFAHVQDYKGLC